MRWQTLLTWACAVALALVPARGEPTLQQRYLDIYLKINDAEHLEKQGDFRGALDDFKDCYDKLARIHLTDPEWESALVEHRMEDCKAKILELQPKADAQVVTAPAVTPDNGTTAPPASAEPAVTSDDVAALKLQLQAVREELQVTKDNLKESQAMVETYRVQLETVNQQLAALKNQQSVDDRMGKLLSDNKDLSDKLAAAQKEIQTYKNSPRGKLSLVQAQLKNVQDEYAASQEANKALQDTTTTLRQQLDQAQADLVAANQKLASAPTASPEYETLKRENEIMRGILTRELQEQAHRDMAKRLFQEEYDNLKLKSKVLQEQVDILASPMTPPTNEEERALLASLKVPAPDVNAPANGNTFSAPAPGTVATTDPSTPPAAGTTPAAPDASTNMASAPSAPPAADTNMVTTTSAPDTNAPSAMTPPANSPASTTPDVSIVGNGPAASANDIATNAAPTASNPPAATTTTVPATDTNSVASTPPAAPSTPPSNPPSTAPAPAPDAAPAAVSSTTPPETAPATPPASTNVAADPASPPTNAAPPTPPPAQVASTSPTNATPGDMPTTTKLPPAQTTVTDTTIQNNDPNAAAAKQNDPTQYSTKARLPDDMRDTAQDAADLFKNQRYDEAAAKYQSIIDKYPESLYAWSNLGVVRFQQGKYEEALKALQQAVKLSPTDAFSYSNLGIVYYQLNQYENAIDALNSAKALDPNDPKTHNYLGCACSQKGWQEVAEKEFRKAIDLDPNFGDAHFNLALVYATSKPPSLELARREYNRALELGIAKDPRLEKLLQM